MAEVVYNVGKDKVRAGAIVSGSTNLVAVMIKTSKTGASDPDLATVAAIDAVGTVAFATERKVLSSVTITVNNTNDRVDIDCADIVFAADAGVTALAMLIYDKTVDTNDTTRIPIAYYDTNFGAGIPMDGGVSVTVADFVRLA
jgi:hypothetical protein